jgi:hypothetical protein
MNILNKITSISFIMKPNAKKSFTLLDKVKNIAIQTTFSDIIQTVFLIYSWQESGDNTSI